MTRPTHPIPARPSLWAVLVTVCLGWAAACQDDNPVEPSSTARTGTLVITVITTGGNQDADGYHLIVDKGTPVEISPSSEVSLVLPNGTHEIEVADIAPNCEMGGGNPRLVTVTTGGTAAVTFQIACPSFGALRISTTTDGPSPDSDGYTLSINGTPRGPLGTQEVLDLGALIPGIYQLRLSSVAGNCSILQGATRWVNVSEGLTEEVLFAVTCVPRIDETPGEKLVVALKSAGDDDFNLYFMDPDSRSVQRLTDNPGDESSPEISPDGNRILFLQFSPAGRSLRVLDRVSRQESVLPTAGVDRAIWSPEGNHIAFVRGGRLFRMNSDGTGEIPLTSGTADRDPYWSPDGTRIAFTRDNRAFLVNADGSGIRQISDDPRASGPWSPDGRRIVLTRLEESCDYYYCYYYGPTWVASDLVLLDVESGDETALTETPLLAEWSPVWASDGLRLYFLFAPAGNPDIHMIGLDGSPGVNLSVSPAAESWISIGKIR